MAGGDKSTAIAKLQREQRRDRVFDYLLAGWKYRPIAAAEQVGVGTIARDVIARLQAMAAASPATGDYRQLQHARITHLTAIWLPRADPRWWQNVEDGRDFTDEQASLRAGHALDQVVKLMRREAKLLGLDAPIQIDHAPRSPLVFRVEWGDDPSDQGQGKAG